MSAPHAARPPQTPEEALRMVKTVEVPVEVFLGWIAALAAVPSQFGGLVYIGMNQVLSETITAVAARHSGGAPSEKVGKYSPASLL